MNGGHGQPISRVSMAMCLNGRRVFASSWVSRALRSSPGPAARADRLACRTLDGKHVSIQARSYVLACGGLETTRLLLASRGPHGGPLGDHSGHLGSWYMGHVDGVIANVKFCTPPRSTVFGYERDIDSTYVRRRFSIRSSTATRTAELIAFLANPELGDHRHGNGVLSLAYLTLRSPLGRLVAPPAQRISVTGNKVPVTALPRRSAPVHSHLMNIARDCASVSRFAVGFGAKRFLSRGHVTQGFFAAYSRDNVYRLQYHGEQIPNRQSRVRLASDRDSVGMPKLKIDLRFSQQDIDGIIRCHEIWDKYLRQNSCGRWNMCCPTQPLPHGAD